jgi:putative oxidoreductase
MLRSLIDTERDFSAFVARVALGVVMLPHGLQKLLGWFGGYGFAGTMQFFTSQGVPSFLAALVIIAESFGALGLIVGLLTRIAAFGIVCIMLVAIFTVHAQFGFFMNWTGKQPGEGFEYHILALALALVCLMRGGGLWSVDRALIERRR